ncbi:MAG: FISUMP domain-containing protein [Saprospiraceae bacterium]
MSKLVFICLVLIGLSSCRTTSRTKVSNDLPRTFSETYVDKRDNATYGIVQVGNQRWFAENLKYLTPNSICYKQKKSNCSKFGRLYPHDELDIVCPEGWRVPNIKDWQSLKSHFQQDSIFALLDTVRWDNTTNHTNASGISFSGTGYQMGKRLFLGEQAATSIWLNQINKFDEYYHVHLYGGEGIEFKNSGYTTNEVFHAHPIHNLEHRRFSIRCVCEKSEATH